MLLSGTCTTGSSSRARAKAGRWSAPGALRRAGRVRAARPLHAREPRRDGPQARRDAGQAGQAGSAGRARLRPGRRQARRAEAAQRAGRGGGAGRPVRAGRAACRSSELQAALDRARRAGRPAHRPAHRDRVAPVRPAPEEADGAHAAAGRTARSAPPSAGASTRSPAARRCTPGWTSRPTPARRSWPPPAAWWSRRKCHPAYGNMVEVDHGNDLVTRYAHASKLLVKKGDLVKRGQKVAEVGTTGRSTGPHLHFEVLVQGVPQDPHEVPAPARPRTWRWQPARRAATRRAPEPGREAGSAPQASSCWRPRLRLACASAPASSADNKGLRCPAAASCTRHDTACHGQELPHPDFRLAATSACSSSTAQVVAADQRARAAVREARPTTQLRAKTDEFKRARRQRRDARRRCCPRRSPSCARPASAR